MIDENNNNDIDEAKIIKNALSMWKYFPPYSIIYQLGQNQYNYENISEVIDNYEISIYDEWFNFQYSVALAKQHFENEETKLFMEELSEPLFKEQEFYYFHKIAGSFNDLSDIEKLSQWCNWLKFSKYINEALKDSLKIIKKRFLTLPPIKEIFNTFSNHKDYKTDERIQKFQEKLDNVKKNIFNAETLEDVHIALLEITIINVALPDYANDVDGIKKSIKIIDEVISIIDRLIFFWFRYGRLLEQFEGYLSK